MTRAPKDVMQGLRLLAAGRTDVPAKEEGLKAEAERAFIQMIREGWPHGAWQSDSGQASVIL